MANLEIFSKQIQKKLLCISDEIISFEKSINPILERKFERQRKVLEEKGRSPRIHIMFHLTDTKSARKIMKEGFKVQKSFYKAFGKGINLCPNILDILKYKRMRASGSGKVSILISKVLIGKAHGNYSDVQKIIEEVNGASYSKPKFMRPRNGFDAMYSLKPNKQIYIIPCGERVLPIGLIEVQDS